MATKPPRPCLVHRCPNYALEGDSYCAEHRRVSPSGKVTQTSRWRRLRRQLIDNAPKPLTCAICGNVIYAETEIDADHIKPVSEGGAPFDPANVRLTHRRCNRRVEQKPHPNAASRRPPWMNKPAA